MPAIDLDRPETWLCRNHPDRPGVGLCVRCGSAICGECATRLDLGLHCASCLSRLRGPGTRRHTRSVRRLGTIRSDAAILLAGFAVLSASLYAVGLLLGAGP